MGMNGSTQRILLAVWLLSAAGCGGVASSAPPPWILKLDVDGTEVEFKLEVLNLFLYDDETTVEDFEVVGEGVTLVGELPSVRVGYGAEWKKVIGHAMELRPQGGDPHEPKLGALRLPGSERVLEVIGGELRPERLTGKYAGRDGDLTLSGRVRLRVRDVIDEREIEGTFAVHVVTWG